MPATADCLQGHQVQVSRLIDCITGGEGRNDSGLGYLVVETNYRVYAYTSSEILEAVLAHFSWPIYKMPNLLVTTITQETIRRAFDKGITASSVLQQSEGAADGSQIVKFLVMNSHPQCVQLGKAVPLAVSNQIKLWETHRKRMTFAAAKIVSYGEDTAFRLALGSLESAGVEPLFSAGDVEVKVQSGQPGKQHFVAVLERDYSIISQKKTKFTIRVPQSQ